MADANSNWSRRRFLGTVGAVGASAGLAVTVGACGLNKGASVDNSGAEGDGWGSNSILLDPPFAKPDVTFTDLDGKPYPLRAKTAGRLTVLAFGYTNCPDICPVYLNTLAGAKATIGSGPGSRPIVLFVGVDIKRDTPKVLKQYLGNIDASFIGLTGTPEVMNQALDQLHLGRPIIGEPDAKGNYLVAHDGRLTVFSPDDKAHRMYKPDVRQQEWIKDLPRLDGGTFR